jgi:hypothetical protein
MGRGEWATFEEKTNILENERKRENTRRNRKKGEREKARSSVQ